VKPRSGGLLFLRRITRSHGVTRSIFAPAFTADLGFAVRTINKTALEDHPRRFEI
jgi:hypothetical protein